MGKYLIIIILFLSPLVGYSAIKTINAQEKKSENDSAKKKNDTSKVNDQIDSKKPDELTKQDDPATNSKSDLNSIESENSGLVVVREDYLSSKHLMFYAISCLFGIITTLFINKQYKKSETSRHEKQIDRLEEKIKELEKSLRRPNQENNLSKHIKSNSIHISGSETIIEEISIPIELSVENKIPMVNDAKILYFPNPNLDGNFKNNEGKEVFIEGAAVYKFTLKNETNANVEFCDNLSSITIALNNRNEMILSLATETNPYNPNASKILIVDNKKAKAQLEDNIWVIKEKAKIKYV
ncbi:hypothetical protein [Pedobacter namyangjuensis]|uniref:hypothetical protein n=1 Tax=Pedobacter namyangjuensis TaxID=600626 RepID=UPI000DE1B7EC|nr:hypothetical protein [Pedobacter namyangjuensis]